MTNPDPASDSHKFDVDSEFSYNADPGTISGTWPGWLRCLARRLGNDEIDGGTENDQLFGDQGDDVLRGGERIDTLQGGSGVNTLYGDAGDDVLDNDQGASGSKLDGGTGTDRIFAEQRV
jgi:Ca2+-binding RTX toxin-like protein